MSNPRSKTIFSMPIETPTAYEIVAVRKDNYSIVAYQLSDGSVIDVSQAISMCEAGQLSGCITGVAKDGTMFIRGVADGDPSNNLDNLPQF